MVDTFCITVELGKSLTFIAERLGSIKESVIKNVDTFRLLSAHRVYSEDSQRD